MCGLSNNREGRCQRVCSEPASLMPMSADTGLLGHCEQLSDLLSLQLDVGLHRECLTCLLPSPLWLCVHQPSVGCTITRVLGECPLVPEKPNTCFRVLEDDLVSYFALVSQGDAGRFELALYLDPSCQTRALASLDMDVGACTPLTVFSVTQVGVALVRVACAGMARGIVCCVGKW